VNNQRGAEKTIHPDCCQIMVPGPKVSMNMYQRTSGQPPGKEAAGHTTGHQQKRAPKGAHK
jgi:hypothetical protein